MENSGCKFTLPNAELQSFVADVPRETCEMQNINVPLATFHVEHYFKYFFKYSSSLARISFFSEAFLSL
jgi:hypothetical protein